MAEKVTVIRKTGLAKLDAATQALAKATDIKEIKQVRDIAEAVRKLAKTAGAGLDIQNEGAKLKIRAERKGGKILLEKEKAKGGQPYQKSTGTTVVPVETYKDMGFKDKKVPIRWQKEAEIPEEVEKEYFKQAEDKGLEITTAGFMREGKDKRREAERAKKAEEGQKSKPNQKYHVDVADIKTFIPKTRYDFIITDPPYPKKYLELYEVLAQRADEFLVEGGLLIAMCGQSYLDKIIVSMSKHLDYYWTGCYWTPGQPKPLRQRQVNTVWKPLLFFTRKSQSYKGKIFSDVFKSEKSEKDGHDWGQSVSGMYSIISMICLSGQSIFDPFLGAGATGVAALMHKCIFRGIDIDESCVNISKGRMNDYLAKG
jgi:16S rRNA G966 N2-methylase RsmD